MKKLHYHFIGIKGVGMTALALCAQDKGVEVTGWDVDEHFVTDKILADRGISWSKDPSIPGNPDLIIMTAAHGGMGNSQILLAQSRGIPVTTYAQAVALMMQGKIGISVCGVGGKTTTVAMLATILDRAGLHPSYIDGVGGISSLPAPGAFNELGKYFIAEADEYAISPGTDDRPKFIFQHPQAVIVTNIEHDHPDIYPSLESVEKVYSEFFNEIPSDGLLVAQIDNSNSARITLPLKDKLDLVTVGLSPRADWRITKVHTGEEIMFIEVSQHGLEEKLTLSVPGNHNALNAVASAAVANHYGVGWDKIQKGIKEFTGTKRRFEFIGENAGIRLYDDYAHHPTEIKTVIKATKEWLPGRRVIVAFQPHTYSRTKALFSQFTKSFTSADFTLFVDIYASKRETQDFSVSSKLLCEETRKINRNVKYIGPKEKLPQELSSIAKHGDVIITMGAGDIFQEHENILKELKD